MLGLRLWMLLGNGEKRLEKGSCDDRESKLERVKHILKGGYGRILERLAIVSNGRMPARVGRFHFHLGRLSAHPPTIRGSDKP
jgi:hypothetical protein